MGLDVYAYAVYGTIVDKSALTKVVNTRGCRHDIGNVAGNFCTECGAKTWVETEEELLESMEGGQLSYFYSDYEDDEVVLGFKLASVSDYDYKEIRQPTVKMIEEISQFCANHNIVFDSEEFKTYMLMYYSY